MTHSLDGWLVEHHVDPNWYAEHGEMSVGPPPDVDSGTYQLQGEQQTVGRRSASRGTIPDVDCTPDTGVSRQHAGFTAEDGRLFLEDLGSANGTFVARVGEQIPEHPIPANRPVELVPGDRVYLGAWTRLDIDRVPDPEGERTQVFDAAALGDEATQMHPAASRMPQSDVPSAAEGQWR